MPPSVSSPVARATVPRERAATDGTLPIDSARVVDDESALHWDWRCDVLVVRAEEHMYELQSLMRISYAVLCLKKQHTPLSTYPHIGLDATLQPIQTLNTTHCN